MSTFCWHNTQSSAEYNEPLGLSSLCVCVCANCFGFSTHPSPPPPLNTETSEPVPHTSRAGLSFLPLRHLTCQSQARRKVARPSLSFSRNIGNGGGALLPATVSPATLICSPATPISLIWCNKAPPHWFPLATPLGPK